MKWLKELILGAEEDSKSKPVVSERHRRKLIDARKQRRERLKNNEW